MKMPGMNEIVSVHLSDDGKRLIVYMGESLISSRAIGDKTKTVADVLDEIDGFLFDDFVKRNGRIPNACMGYSDCRSGNCDEHYPES
jgi:hypothetical protein